MTEPAHVLVVDDDPDIRDELQEYLTGHGFRVSTAEGGAAMHAVLEKETVDLIIMDLKMPGESGLSLTSSVRKTSKAGVIILTGTGDDVDRVVGLEIGADDYIAKPCNLRELLARVRSVLRRTRGEGGAGLEVEAECLQFAGWTLDLSERRLTSPDSAEVPLTTGEFNMLEAFVTRPKRVLNRDQILDLTQGRDWSPYDRSIDNLISRLRQKIEADPKNPQIIKTVRGVGYLFTPAVSKK